MTIRRLVLALGVAFVLLAIIAGVSSHARAAAVCTPTSTVSGPYARDGAGDVCFQTANLCSFINSWNMTTLEVNGTAYTNQYVSSNTIVPLNGAYIIHYVGAYPWSHFEFGGTCSTTPPPTTPPPTTPPPTTPPPTTPPPTTPPPSGNTGWVSPTAQAAQSGGDGNGFQTSPTSAFGDDSAFATDTDSGNGTSTSCTSTNKDRHAYYSYPISIPAGSTINGIEVRLDSRADSTSGSPRHCVELSWNNGSSWTAAKQTGTLTTSMASRTLGSASDNWGRTWTTGELTSATLRVRITNVASSTSRDFFLDWVPVRVTYGGTSTPPPTTPPPTTPPPTTPPPTTPPPTTPPPTTPPPGTHLANPFVGAVIYKNVDYVASVNAAANANPTLASRMRQVGTYPTFVWMDSIDAVNGTNGYPRSLVGHMQQAVAQGANTIEIVVYDLPNRDCSALASNGELLIAQDGFNRYKNEYINPIAAAVGQFPNLRVIAVIEPDSLPNLHTNLSFAKCQEANGAGGYRDGVVYALNTLGAYSNFYSYIDIGHHGWLGWQDSNFLPAGTLIANTVKMATKGVNSIDGFISNTANTSALVEPYHTANQSIGGQPARSAKFHDWNTYIDELSYAQAWRTNMINTHGFPSGIGMLVDTSRNGWGGTARPTGPSTSTDLNTFVNASRIDRRIHKGNWCNQSGAGIGERPVANPAAGIDAYVWVKPPGESDGSSSLIPVGPDNPAGKGFDRMCDPTYTGNSLNGNSMTGALPGAPVSGRWFMAQFVELVTNAYPPFQ